MSTSNPRGRAIFLPNLIRSGMSSGSCKSKKRAKRQTRSRKKSRVGERIRLRFPEAKRYGLHVSLVSPSSGYTYLLSCRRTGKPLMLYSERSRLCQFQVVRDGRTISLSFKVDGMLHALRVFAERVGLSDQGSAEM
jgi:hypothetical protein